MERRVVVTGLGAITPIGNTTEEFWDSLKEGKCGVDEITLFDTTGYKVKNAAEVKNINFEDYYNKKEIRRLDRNVIFSLIATKEAIKDANIDLKSETNTINPERVGVVVSSGIGGIITIQDQCKVLNEKGPDRISPFFIPMSISNMPAGNISIETGAKGESLAIITACASSTNSIGESYRIIKNGYQDVVITGGCEAAITEISIGGFAQMRALSTNIDKNRASIPFDKQRDGFVMGEGSGVLILEDLEHAQKRRAKIYAEIVGYSATSDAYHITAPAETGEGAKRAMANAVAEAKIEAKDITYINAHGTSTPMNDKIETNAIKSLLGEDAKKACISSTKSMTGHLLGASGAVEAIACIKSIENDYIPATINYKEEDPECDLNYVPNKSISKKVKYAMSNSLGFGGHNSSIIFKKYEK